MRNPLLQLLNRFRPKTNIASLRRTYFITPLRIKCLRLSILTILILLSYLLVIKLNIHGIFQITIFLLLLYLIINLRNRLNNKISAKTENIYIRDKLLYIIRTNGLYTSEKVDNREIITSSAILSFKNIGNDLVIVAHATGNQWSDRIRILQSQLQAVFQLNLLEQKDYAERTEYHFRKIKPKRLILKSSNSNSANKTGTISLGYDIEYTPSKTPHILVQGGTGSGKSMFISYLILELLKQEATLYIADPKNSNLGSLSQYLGDSNVAYTANNIARIVRIAVKEMNERYEYMRQNFVYGSNFETHKLKPIWIIFDEMGAFSASADKSVLSEVMDGIKQIVLLGRQAGIFLLISAQQMNANVLSTELRDNLGLRIALGSNSSEGYRMVLGDANKDLRPIDTIGGGYLYMQGSGSDSATYYETPFMPKDFDFINELQQYINIDNK